MTSMSPVLILHGLCKKAVPLREGVQESSRVLWLRRLRMAFDLIHVHGILHRFAEFSDPPPLQKLAQDTFSSGSSALEESITGIGASSFQPRTKPKFA